MSPLHTVEMFHIHIVEMFHIHTVEMFHIHTDEIFHIHTVENVQCSQKWSDRFSDRFWTKIGLFPGGPGRVPGRFLDNGKGFPLGSRAVSDNFFGLFRKVFGKVSR